MSILKMDKEDMTLSVAILILVVAFLVSLAIVKLATIIVPGLPFWPAMGILWLVKLFF
jgi:hypothetical protein